MGYYSQVGYVIQGKKEEMVPIIMTYRLAYKDPKYAKQALGECTYSLQDEWFTIKFHTDSAKWYESYEDVECHTALFEAFREAAETYGSTINGMFIRIGEEDTDIYTKNYGSEPYELMNLSRSIEFEVAADDNLEAVLGGLE